MSQPFDTTLMHSCLDRWLAGEPAAADELLRAAAGRLEMIARSSLRRFPGVARWEAAEDVLQSACVRMIRCLAVTRPHNTRGFYHMAATHIRRELLDLARKYRKMAAPPGPGADGQEAFPAGDIPDRAALDTDLLYWETFHDAVDRLPAQEREVVGLMFYHGWTHAQIAAMFHVDARTIRRWWKAASDRLAEQLREAEPRPARRPGPAAESKPTVAS